MKNAALPTIIAVLMLGLFLNLFQISKSKPSSEGRTAVSNTQIQPKAISEAEPSHAPDILPDIISEVRKKGTVGEKVAEYGEISIKEFTPETLRLTYRWTKEPKGSAQLAGYTNLIAKSAYSVLKKFDYSKDATQITVTSSRPAEPGVTGEERAIFYGYSGYNPFTDSFEFRPARSIIK